MIKARPCAGDIAAGEAFLKEVAPFIWRKYLDYGAVADVHAMKRQMAAYKGHDEIAIEGHNIKLGRGGIREIEFFVQTQQLIAGGRHPELRGRETLATLDDLAEGGWIDREARARPRRGLSLPARRSSTACRWSPTSRPTRCRRSARRSSASRASSALPDRDAFAAALLEHLRKVQRHYARLFEDAPGRRGLAPRARVSARQGRHRERSTSSPRWASAARSRSRQAVRRWLVGRISLAQERVRARASRRAGAGADRPSGARRKIPTARWSRSTGSSPGCTAARGCCRCCGAIPTSSRCSRSCSAPRRGSPTFWRMHPQVMDALIEPSFFGALPDAEKLARRTFAARSRRRASYEDLLDRARLFGQEHMFLIGARILSGTVSAEQAGEAFARLADVLIRAVHRAVEDNFAAAHGRLRGQQSAVLALGKLGGREMTAASDLDLIIVYDFDENASAVRRRAPALRHAVFRAADPAPRQRADGADQLRRALSCRHAAAPVRPLRAGRHHARLVRELPGERGLDLGAHGADARARGLRLAGLRRAGREGHPRRAVPPRDAETIAGDVVEMRGAIATEKGDGDRWDLKYAAGGLIDLEFIAQYLQLVHAAEQPDILDTATARVLDKAARLGVLAPEDADVLRPAVRLYQDLTQILRLCLTGPFDPKAAGPGLLSLLARAADVPDFATLEAHLAETQARVRASFVRILGQAP